jgi:hypothetical protein
LILPSTSSPKLDQLLLQHRHAPGPLIKDQLFHPYVWKPNDLALEWHRVKHKKRFTKSISPQVQTQASGISPTPAPSRELVQSRPGYPWNQVGPCTHGAHICFPMFSSHLGQGKGVAVFPYGAGMHSRHLRVSKVQPGSRA